MAFVQSMGARVHIHTAPDVENPAAEGSVVFGVQLFAVLPSGSIVMAHEANGLSAERLPENVAELGEMIQLGLHAPSIDTDVRSAVFGNLIAELARMDIRTDLETLMHLPFRLEVTDEVRALLEG